MSKHVMVDGAPKCSKWSADIWADGAQEKPCSAEKQIDRMFYRKKAALAANLLCKMGYARDERVGCPALMK